MSNNNYRQCNKCIMDTTDPKIQFDENGVCSHCRDYEAKHSNIASKGKKELEKSIKAIKRNGKGKKYDCILGLSGGTDSTYVAYLAKKYELNPLVVHLDNGWNSELAVNNIENIVTKLGFDLYTYVIDWEEFKDMQLSYLKASVVDIEAITDHAIFSTLYLMAAKYKVKYLLVGLNVVTEAILPSSWIYSKMDAENIKDIHKQYGKLPIKSFPLMDMWLKQYYFKIRKIKMVPVLDFVPYVKEEAKKTITKELEWRDYGGKHYESVFTRFYQGYILPEKFNIDKRKAHLSTLICSKQLTRNEALEEMSKPIYDPELLKVDKEFVLKKFGLSEKEFDDIMKLPIKKHVDFKTEGSVYKHYPIFKPLKPIVDLIKRN